MVTAVAQERQVEVETDETVAVDRAPIGEEKIFQAVWPRPGAVDGAGVAGVDPGG
jgi:hypothetical protein